MLWFWILLLLLLLVLALLPTWPYSREWGYVPSATAFALVVLLLILLWLGIIAMSLPWYGYTY